MHLAFIATGIKQNLELFEKYMETRTFPMKSKDPNGKEVTLGVQGALRPINFYEFIFPREHLSSVVNSIGCCHEWSKKGTNAKLNETPFMLLRKAMKLKKIPAIDPKAPIFPVFRENIRTIGIGIREDKDWTFKSNGHTHEGL